MTPSPGAATPGEATNTVATSQRIWSRPFVLICLTTMFGYSHSGLLSPIIPLYLYSLGESEFVIGLVLAAFSVTSFTIRPLLGHLTDTWSLRGVLGMGTLLLGLTSVGYTVAFVPLIGLVHGVRGIAWAAFNTGINTLVAHAAPTKRRAEASSYLTLFQNGPSSLSQPLALWILVWSASNYSLLFLLAAAAGICASVASAQIPFARILPPRQVETVGPMTDPVAAGVAGLVDRGVLLATVLLSSLTMVQPAALAFVPLRAREIGIDVDTVAWYFVVVGAASVVGRGTLGRISDRLGRGVSLVAGLSLAMTGMVVLAFATNLAWLMVAAVAYAVGAALHQPATMALAIDRADPRRRGRAMASYSLGFQLGVGGGAVLAGALAEWLGYSAMYLAMLVPPGVGLSIVLLNWRALQRRAAVAVE